MVHSYVSNIRKETAGEVAHIAVALPGAPSGTPQALAFAIAAKGKRKYTLMDVV